MLVLQCGEARSYFSPSPSRCAGAVLSARVFKTVSVERRTIRVQSNRDRADRKFSKICRRFRILSDISAMLILPQHVTRFIGVDLRHPVRQTQEFAAGYLLVSPCGALGTSRKRDKNRTHGTLQRSLRHHPWIIWLCNRRPCITKPDLCVLHSRGTA